MQLKKKKLKSNQGTNQPYTDKTMKTHHGKTRPYIAIKKTFK